MRSKVLKFAKNSSTAVTAVAAVAAAEPVTAADDGKRCMHIFKTHLFYCNIVLKWLYELF